MISEEKNRYLLMKPFMKADKLGLDFAQKTGLGGAYNRFILNIASAIRILQSVEGLLGIDISRTYAG